jgi:predicted ATPase/Tfp pilus assembly protein PilF
MALPHPKTRFFGRSTDLDRLAAACASGDAILALLGPPGIGKTRLAIELCRAGLSRRGSSARVWFCDLTAARDAADVCAEVGRALGVDAPFDARAIAAALGAAAPSVLVLDNFEQVVRHAAETVGVWSEGAPQVCFVVTSRERLRLEGEVVHELMPLGNEAVELFIDRARAASGGSDLCIDAGAVAELVERLEGIPLAIELAAARVDVLGVAGLLERLARPLELLCVAQRDAAPHHAALRQAIDSSYRLLAPLQQQALAQCAAFRGSFTLDAAEAVIGPDPAVPVLDLLQGLRDRSLLRRRSEGDGVRFQLLDCIRAYALDALHEHGDEAETRARHARHYLAAGHPLPAADHGNLIEAAAHALGDPGMRGDSLGLVVAALGAVEPSVAADGLVDLLRRALELAVSARLEASLRAVGHRALGAAERLRGRSAQARVELGRALELAHGDRALVAEVCTDLGVVHHQLRDMDRARACYGEALELLEGRDVAARARCLGNLGALEHDIRRYDAGLACYEQALAGFRAAGDHGREAIFLTNIGVLLQERGSFARARANYLAALERLAPGKDRRFEAITRTNLGLLCHEMGEVTEACLEHERALAIFEEVVDPRSRALCAGRLAMSLAATGRGDEAGVRSREAERLLAGVDDRAAPCVLRLFRAHVELLGSGDVAAAAAAVAEARALSVAGGSPLVDLSDDARAAVRLIEAALAARGPTASVLLVGPQATWFTPPGGPAQDLGGRQVLRRLLLRLVSQHREAPGEGLTLDALRDAGWPGERAMRASAANRVHVALTELRRRGLKPCLLRRQERYLLDPAVQVRVSELPVSASQLAPHR